MKFVIKNITKNSWLRTETNGRITHTKDESSRLVFSDEEDAEQTLEYLNDSYSDSYVLITL